VPHVVSAALLVWLLVLTWIRRREPLAPWLAAVFGALLLWTAGYALELASVSLAAKLFWANLQFVGLFAIPVLWLGVTQRALGWADIARSRWLVLSVLIAALLAVVYLNPHHLFRGHPALLTGGPVPLLAPDYGPLFYALCVPFSLTLVAISVTGFVRAAHSGLPLYRARAALLLGAMLLPVVGGALYMAGAGPWREFDPASATLSVAAVLCGVALLRYRAFDVAPLAREALVDQLADGIVVVNVRGLLIDFNAAAAAILPELRASALGLPVGEVFAARPELATALRRPGEAGEAVEAGDAREAGWAAEPRGAGGAGPTHDDSPVVAVDTSELGAALRRRHFSLVRTALRDRSGRDLGEAVVFHDLTRRLELFARVERLATIDELTGLLTRRQLNELGERELARARRQRLPIAVLLFDLDRFKAINDRHHHATGDDVLRAVATACRAELRVTDLFGRYGGDEFCAVLPDLDGEGAGVIAERLRAAVAGVAVWHDGELVRTSASIGVAGCREASGETVAGLVRIADAGLYAAKRRGGDRVVVDAGGGLLTAAGTAT
jgi:diguanylate cyclase (GGDEF)-like protein